MKRASVASVVIALTIGLAAGLPAQAAGQGYEADELRRAPSYGFDLDVEVWVNEGEAATYREGAEVKVRFRTNRDCYVVIYDIDTEGFLHLLFPDDPYDDGFVQGGRIYRLPDHGARYSLVAEGPPGIEYISAVASDYPIARQLPWYLDGGYESAGYKGHHDIEATVDDVGAVRGDPFVAMQDIAYDILPEYCTEEEYDTDYTYFHVSRRSSHPRYVCYDCHGRSSWFDPYDDVCTVVDIRVDLDWHFVRHPTLFYVGPRYWYWRRYDCPTLYVSVPQFWCSLYPRHLFFDHFYFGVHRVGVWYESRGHRYPPVRYHGRPGVWGGGYGGRYPDRPGYGKPPRHDVLDTGVKSPGERRHYGRGKTTSGLPAEVRKPQRLGKPEVETRETRTTLQGRGVKGKDIARGKTKDIEQKNKRDKRPGALKAKVSKQGDGGRQKTKARVSEDKPVDRSKTKGDVRKGKTGATSKTKVSKRGKSEPEKSKGKAIKQKSGSRSKTKAKLSTRDEKGRSQAKAKVSKGQSSRSKAKVSERKSKSGSKSKSKAEVSKRKARTGSKSEAKSSKGKMKSGSKSKSRAKASDRKAKSKTNSKSKQSRKAGTGKNKSTGTK